VDRACGTHGSEEKSLIQSFGGKARRRKPLGRPRRRWEDRIRMDLREVGWGCRVDPVGLRQGPVTGSCEYGDEPLGSGATDLVS
jgi:hypothetical protein